MDWRALLINDLETFNKKIAVLEPQARTMFRGSDLRNLDLSKADLRNCDLTGADLSNAHLDGNDLATCRLEKTVLDDIVIKDEYWMKEVQTLQLLWSGAEKYNTTRDFEKPIVLTSANFSGADFKNTDFTYSTCMFCNFRETQFSGGNWTDSIWNKSDFFAARFSNMDFFGANFSGVDLGKNHWEDIKSRHVKFTEANLGEGSFLRVIFYNCTFNDADLSNTIFENCSFDHCSFFDTHLSGTQFINCNLKEVNLEDGHTDGLIIL